MNRFVHGCMHHFLQKITDGEGNDLSGADDDHEQEEEQEEEEQEPEEEDEPEAQEEDETVLTIEGEKPTEEEQQAAEAERSAPKWVKELRQQHREAQRELRELRAKVSAPAAQQQAQQLPELGKKPTMEDDDVDWDAEKFEKKLEAWHDRKREIDRHEESRQQSERKQKEEWDGRLATYASAKTALKFKDFDDAEENAKTALDVTQQGIILQGADNSALIVYALGKNPKKAAELGAIKDPIKFAFAIAKLETKLKVESKKVAATAPEKVVTGGQRSTASSDSTLEKLREEAQRTGNTDKLMAYKRQQKNKGK